MQPNPAAQPQAPSPPAFPGDRRSPSAGRRLTDNIEGNLGALRRTAGAHASRLAIRIAARLLAAHGMQDAHELLIERTAEIMARAEREALA